MTGPFRMGWAWTTRGPQNFLEPLYATDAGANFSTTAGLRRLVAKGNAAATSGEAIRLYNEAEDVLLEDMPIIPLFFSQSVGPIRPTSPTSWSTRSAGWTLRR